jgi:endoglucanase
MGIGWNLGNSLDALGNETSWGNPTVTQDLINAVDAAGFGVVRIPVTWIGHFGDAPDYTIDADWLNRVEEVVNYVLDTGMYAIINLHHDGAEGIDGEWLTLDLADSTGTVSDENNEAVRAQFVKIWEQIADHFKDYGDKLIFESMNELHVGYSDPSAEYYTIVNNLNQAFVDTVRQSGGNNSSRIIVVPGYNTNITYTVAGFEAPDDTANDKMILSCHYYDPWNFAGAGSTPVWGADYDGNDGWGQEDWVLQQFDSLQSTYINQGIPVIIGEYGAVNPSASDSVDYRRYYMEYVTKAASDRGIVPIYWDNGSLSSGAEAFGLFDRSSNSVYHQDILDAMMQAVTSSYSINDIEKP